MNYEALATRHPVAAKSYPCVVCLQPIDQGVKHVLEVGIFEGDFQSARLHERCSELADEYAINTGESYEFWEVQEWLNESGRMPNPTPGATDECSNPTS